MGSVAGLGRDTTGNVWLIGKSKTQRARARVVLRLVDPKTGEVFYTQEGSGEARSNKRNGYGLSATGATGKRLGIYPAKRIPAGPYHGEYGRDQDKF